ncbi:MAG: preprotein translocase subunit SecA [Candidatus Paceibacterota bacterium]
MAFSIQSFFDKNKTKGYAKRAAKIGDLEEHVASLADEQFPLETESLKARLAAGESLDAILPEAFALVREAAKRTMNKRHYDVQLIGGMVLHEGNIAEMRTGEGKTLVGTLPVYLNALTGRGVHVVTVNDYLARRDATWMGQIYSFLGLSVGIINDQNQSFVYDPAHQEMDEERDEEGSFKVIKQFLRTVSRKDAYLADITYGTNSQFGFDYLRDNLVNTKEEIVQRDHYFAVVDEVDSILIDESRTPLIISSPISDSESLYKTVRDVAGKLEVEKDYVVDEKLKAITLTDEGITKAEKLLGIDNMYTEKGIKYAHYLETAVRARALFQKDKDYVVKDGEVVIVDTFTGRMQPGRRWSEGLHQAIEAKEGVKVEQETRSVASITYQNYFKLYEKLSGMSGTAKTSEEEFMKVYSIGVISVPTHRPVQRIDHNDLIFQTETGKFEAIAQKVKGLNAKRQPVLIGTVSIEKNELLAAYLKKAGIPHQVLNAKNHENEGSVIAQAGKKGSVVIATNLAGRGVDIILGGTSSTPEEQQEVKDLGGLFVIGTERHEARRIDNQLRGRSGRQGDPGETQFYVSLEDELMRVFGTGMKNMMNRFNIPEDQPIDNGFVTRALETAQKKIEGFHFDARKSTLEYDTVLSFQRTIIYGRRRAMVEGDKGHIMSNFFALDSLDILEPIVKEKVAIIGEDAFWENVRRIVLYTTDTLWVEHIDTMEHTRQSVGLRSYGQREPLVEYKKEATKLFREMEQRLKDQVIAMVSTISK